MYTDKVHRAMDKKKLIDSFAFFTPNAKRLLKDKGQTINRVQEAFKKADLNRGALATIWDNLHLLLSLAKDYSQGNYTAIPTRSIIALFAGLLYFISPLDFIPDFIFGLGFIDDIYILTLVYKQLAKDLEKYKIWRDGKRNIIHI